MQDVIFSGSRKRQPLGKAEVTVRLKSRNGHPYTIQDNGYFEITRKLFRNGDSEYLINGKRCRLKDIYARLGGTGLGKFNYSIIEQGKVDTLLSSKPVERRLLLEEAAGISGYRQKKEHAQHKLENANLNLERIKDIISEMERQRRALKRQASKARSFKKLKEEEKKILYTIFLKKEKTLREESTALNKDAEAARDEETSASACLASLEATEEKIKRALEGRERLQKELRERQHALKLRMERTEVEIESLKSRIKQAGAEIESEEKLTAQLGERRELLNQELRELEEALTQTGETLKTRQIRFTTLDKEKETRRQQGNLLQKEISAIREKNFEVSGELIKISNEKRNLEKAHERGETAFQRLNEEYHHIEEKKNAKSEEINRLNSELEETTRESKKVSRELEEISGTVKEKEGIQKELADNYASIEKNLISLKEKLKTLKEIESSGELLGKGTKDFLDLSQEHGIKHDGTASDHMEVETGFEKAVSSAIPSLDAILVKSREEALRGVNFIREKNKGKTSFLILDESPGSVVGSHPVQKEKDIISLSEKIKTDNGPKAALASLSDQSYIVDEKERASALSLLYPEVVFVTPDGIRFGPGPFIHLLDEEEKMGKLFRIKNEVKVLESKAKETAREKNRLEKEKEKLKREIEELTLRKNDLLSKSYSLNEKLVSAKVTLEHLHQEQEALLSRCEIMEMERERAGGEVDEIKEKISQIEIEEKELSGKKSSFEKQLQEKTMDLEKLNSCLEENERDMVHSRDEISRLRERRENLSSEIKRVKDGLSSVDGAEERARNNILRYSEGMEKDGREISKKEGSIRELNLEYDEIWRKSLKVDSSVQKLASLLEGKESEVRSARSKHKVALEKVNELEVHLARVSTSLEHLKEEFKGSGTFDNLTEEEGRTQSEEEPAWALEELEEKLAKLRAKITRAGPVNLIAMEEFEALDERYKFTLEQEKDLSKSIDSLKKTIQEIDKISRERFNEAFETINEYFDETFKILFGGGRAAMRLTDESDPLESGLEIIAQPSGKKLQSISLLSGGEKALSAIALIFAFFKYSPSPFCVMDEVDASLDEANILKFTNLIKNLREEVQFILITHNKMSMQAADVLYGITMEEPGITRLVAVRLD